MPLRRAVLPLAALASLLAAGCGGGDPTPHAQAQEAPGARVIRGWADDVRHGRYAQAAARFDVPATVQNGTPPLVLDTRTQVDLFNRSLPCGAVLLATRRIEGGRLLATFRLTEGPDPSLPCGSGVGHRAQVAFRVRAGHIVEWIRVVDRTPSSAREV